MTQDIFEKMLDRNGYQVFLMTCPASLPLSFAPHPWFVVNKKGVLFRSGISWKLKSEMSPELFKGHPCIECSGYLHKDTQPALKGCNIFPFFYQFAWTGRVCGKSEGEEAQKMIEIIENAYTHYPYCNEYSLLGPNSATYIKWVLSHFPKTQLKLPWNTIGRAC